MITSFSDSLKTYAAIACVLLFFAGVLATLSRHGAGGRVFAPLSDEVVTVSSPEQAVLLWQEKKVRGRILLLFDKNPHLNGFAFNGKGPALTRYTFVEYAIVENMVRGYYCVVPAGEWNAADLKTIRPAPGMAKGAYLYNLYGVPAIATTPVSLPRLSEPPLVYINTRYFSVDAVKALLADKGIRSDCMVAFQGGE